MENNQQNKHHRNTKATENETVNSPQPGQPKTDNNETENSTRFSETGANEEDTENSKQDATDETLGIP